MRSYKLILALLVLLSALFLLWAVIGTGPAPVPSGDNLPFPKGERISYCVKWGGLKIGTAISNFLGETNFRGKKAYLITFSTNTFGFKDIERIYADPESLYPLYIERTVSLGKLGEKIIEEYDQKSHTLKISKRSGKEKEEKLIKAGSNIQNTVLLFYYCRNREFKVGDTFSAALPTSEYKLEVVRKEELETALGKRPALLFASRPEGIKFWVEANGERLLLKMKKSAKVGSWEMSITKVERGDE